MIFRQGTAVEQVLDTQQLSIQAVVNPDDRSRQPRDDIGDKFFRITGLALVELQFLESLPVTAFPIGCITAGQFIHERAHAG